MLLLLSFLSLLAFVVSVCDENGCSDSRFKFIYPSYLPESVTAANLLALHDEPFDVEGVLMAKIMEKCVSG